MADRQELALAAALASSMRDHHVTETHVRTYSGLALNTIRYILSGKTKRPNPRTLMLIARAIATDAYTREVDHEMMAEIERTLAIGAGYADPTALEARSLLERSLFYVLASREGARAWVEVITRLAALPPDAVRRLPDRAER